MNLARGLRLLLALALLNAQHAALAHQVWHFADLDKQPAQSQLCAHHEALDTVAGGMDSPAVLLPGDVPAGFSFLFLELPSAATPGLAPSSRGPPALL